MSLKEKINSFLESVGSNQRELADTLDLNYQRMNKNISNGKLTIEVAVGLAKLYPALDMNWFMREDDHRPFSLLQESESVGARNEKIILDEIKCRMTELENLYLSRT